MTKQSIKHSVYTISTDFKEQQYQKNELTWLISFTIIVIGFICLIVLISVFCF